MFKLFLTGGIKLKILCARAWPLKSQRAWPQINIRP